MFIWGSDESLWDIFLGSFDKFTFISLTNYIGLLVFMNCS